MTSRSVFGGLKLKVAAIIFLIAAAVPAAVLAPPAAQAAEVRQGPFTLSPGQAFIIDASGNGFSQIILSMQTDGNLVIYRKNTGSGSLQWIWASWTQGNPGAYLRFQSDGNLVIYRSVAAGGGALWHTYSWGNPQAVFVLSQSGNMALFDENSDYLWTSGSSQVAGQLPGNSAPFTAPFADGTWHSHISVESNPAERADWEWRFIGPGAEEPFEVSDLSVNKASTYTSTTDVYYFQQQGSGAADATCMDFKSNGRCEQFRIRFYSDFADTHSSHMKNNAVCHEFGHTVGFDDGGLNGGSCMTGGDNTRLAGWEVLQLNSLY